MIAEIGTPSGASTFGEMLGHCRTDAVKRLFGCAAGVFDAGVHGWPCQSRSSAGGVGSRPSHHGAPSFVIATFVKMTSLWSIASAFGFVFALVPGATPKKPASGLMAQRRPS